MTAPSTAVRTLAAVAVVAGVLVGVVAAAGSAAEGHAVGSEADLGDSGVGASDRLAAADTAADRPENVTVHVIVRTRGVGNGDVRVRVRYPARNESEAQQAENGTVKAAWFDGDERVRAAFEERGEPLSQAEQSPESHVTSPTISASEHGDVVLTRTYRWDGPFPSDGDRFEMGRTLAANLESGTVLRVQVPSNWTPERTTTEPEPVGHSGTLKEYRWRVGGESDPAVAFNRSVADSDDTDAGGQPLGLAGGAVVAVVAVHLWAAGRYRRAR